MVLNSVLDARLGQLQEMKNKAEEAKVFLECHLGEINEEITAIKGLLDIYKKRPNNDPDLYLQYDEVIAPAINKIKNPKVVTPEEKQKIKLVKSKQNIKDCPILNDHGKVDYQSLSNEIRSIMKEHGMTVKLREITSIIIAKYPILNNIWADVNNSMHNVIKTMEDVQKDNGSGKGYYKLLVS